jgi:undecaprenyl-diphosphatase
MRIIEAIILGILQGLTEFLPVSSSGHLEIGKAILGVNIEEDLGFTVLVHFATVLSTITVFFSEIRKLLAGLFKFSWNEETKYISKLLFSAIPVLIVGILLEEEVELLFSKSDATLVYVGIALLITAALLALTSLVQPGKHKNLPFSDAFIIGIAQALAVIPGLSRSGATIATGLLLKNNREQVARFSFLMVLVPIIGASLLKLLDWSGSGTSDTSALSLAAGFIAAYISGFLACKWMINIVKRGKLIWFAIYCSVVGLISIIFSL